MAAEASDTNLTACTGIIKALRNNSQAHWLLHWLWHPVAQNFFAAFNLLGSWRVCSCTQLTNVYVDSLKCYVNKNWLHSLIMIYKTYTGIWKPVLQHSLQWNTKWDWNGAWFVWERGSSKVRGSQTIQSQTLFLQHPSLFLLLSCSCPKQKHGRMAGFPPSILKFLAQSKWEKQRHHLGALSCYSAVCRVRQTWNMLLSCIPRMRWI